MAVFRGKKIIILRKIWLYCHSCCLSADGRVSLGNRNGNAHWDSSLSSLTDSNVFSMGFLFRSIKDVKNTWSAEPSNKRAVHILKLHFLPFFQLRKWFVQTFLILLMFSDVVCMVDDSECIHQVGAEKRFYILWEEFPPASPVPGPVGEVTDHFGRRCCNRNMYVYV